MLLKLLSKFWRGAVLCLILTLGHTFLLAEGTKQLDPNSSDYTKLMTNNAFYGSFAEYNGTINSRLFIHIANPSSELVYIGLSRGTVETFDAMGFYDGDLYNKDYYFRIVSPEGVVVYGPTLIDGSSANINSHAEAVAGPSPIVGVGGYTPFVFDPAGMTAGDYYIEFSDNENAASTEIIDIPYFDISVADNSGATPTAIDGRLWSYNWAFKTTPTLNSSSSTYGNFDRSFNGVVYAYTDDGFVNKIDFANSGFKGWFFTLAFNATGAGDSGDVIEDRKSVEGNYSVNPQYKIFLNDPDINVYPTGVLGSITADPQINICDPGAACIWVETTLEGQVEILIDINTTSGAGNYDLDSEDVLLISCISALPGETAPFRRCIEWDGLDGLGASVNMGSNMSVYTKLQQGVTHYASYDVEFVTNGYTIDVVRPAASVFIDDLYYDDSAITEAPGNGAPKVALDGCTSPCHSWTDFNYGDENTINTWWISHSSSFQNLHIPWCVPTAVEDTSYTSLSSPIVIDVTANDLGAGLWLGSVNVSTLPVNGSVDLNPSSGEITYTPNPGFTGEDRFWYEVCNADSPPTCDDTWVVVYVNGVNAVNDDNNTIVNMGVSGNVLTNDVDNEGDDITLTLTPYQNPTHGGVVLSSDGSYTYTPSTDFVGQDQFRYIICDNGIPTACDTATTVITVSDHPSFSNNEVIANADENITNVGLPVSANVLANDVDVDGDNLTVNTTPTTSPAHGTVLILSDGSYTYTPNAGFAGQDQFAYEVCDDGTPQACAGAIVVIDVIPDLNGTDPNPPFAGDDFNVTNINTMVAGDVSTNDTGGGAVNTTPVTAPNNGVLTLNTDGSYIYTPNNGFTGADQFVYQSCVSGGNGTTSNNYPSSDIPISTVDNNSITSTINITSGGTISDLNLTNLNINHTWIGDLSISLTSPNMTTVVVYQNLCGNSVPGYDITVDDEGAAVALCSDLNNGGVYQAFNGSLSDFDGEESTGVWTLTISDNASGDGGALNSWGLEIETLDVICSQATAYLLVMPPPVTDLDEDNDGIPDIQEAFTGDHDNDGIPDWEDLDFCNAVFQGVNGWDCSNGIPDPDFDMDGDGIPNVVDSDYPYIIPDSDGDGVYDYLDLDADNDGLPDLIEAGGTDIDGNGLVDDPTDSDGDGLVDIYDPENATNPGVNEGLPLNLIDTDEDGVADHLDLDADNDGIPDLIELGGIDSNGDGRVDDLTDSDTDGLVDSYDPSNASNAGSNEGTPHFVTGSDSGDGTPTLICTDCSHDHDQIPPHLDLDADDDGILDIVEAGGIDANNDGQVADATGSNGYSNALDPEDGGSPYFTVGADDAGDNNNRLEYTSVVGRGDSDGDDVPDFLDVDADNDGIHDNYEAQPTIGYERPSGIDTDGDGIDDSYDADALATQNGVTPHNMDGLDLPDYLDLDTDNDNIPDWQEAWDHLFDGDSQRDNVVGDLALDSDGDGLLDGYDSDDVDPSVFDWEVDPAGDIDGDNGMAAGTLFNSDLLALLPENGGLNNAEPDYRDRLISCGTPVVYYGLSEVGGATTQYTYNPITQMHEESSTPTITRATTYCERDGWFYFYNPLQPTNYLFAIRYNVASPGTIPINELVNYIEIRLDDNPAGRTVANGSNAQLVMARDWHVVFKREAEVGSKYDIKYYYDPQEMLDLIAAAEDLQGYSGIELKWFKADQGNEVSFDVSDIAADSIPNMTDISSYATASLDWSTGEVSTDGMPNVDAGNGRNYISFEGLPGFSGGTALISMSAALPVELNTFSAEENGCQIDLSWVTLSEENFSHFELERSENGKDYRRIESINSLGVASGSAYFFNDYPSRGTFYYRLKIVDLDGSFSYSGVSTAIIQCGEVEDDPIRVYPNPIMGSDAVLNISCETPKDRTTFLVMDVVGKVWLSQTIVQEKGWLRTTINIGDLPPGSYYLVSRDIGIGYSKKILKLE